MAEGAAAAAAAVAAAVTVKLPGFWCSGSAAWFFQAEAQFALRGITVDDTKYYHVVSALDASTAMRAASVLQDPPADAKYQALKDFLLGAFEPTEAERGERLLAVVDLGDRKPSELADHILALNGAASQHFLLRSLFLRAMPAAVRNAISTSPLKDLRQLALEADKVAATCAGPSFAGASTEQFPTDPEALAVGAADRKSRRLCRYHQRFGRSAKRCCSPCDWTTNPPRRQGNAWAGPR